MKQADGYLLETIAGVPYLLPYGQNIADLKRGVQLNDTGVFLWQTLAQEISSDELLHKFFTFFEIENQSTIVKIPQTPSVNNFKIPMPVSPIINLSIPRLPKNMDTRRMVVGSLKSMVEINENFSSSIVLNLSFKYIIFSAGKNF